MEYIIGGTVLFIGICLLVVGLGDLALRRAIRRTPTSSIGDARGGPIEIKGHVVAIKSVRSPFTARPGRVCWPSVARLVVARLARPRSPVATTCPPGS